jgi:hypothetical protein
MVLLHSIRRWFGSSKTERKSELSRRSSRLTLEGMEGRLLLSSSPVTGAAVLTGEWFVQSNGRAATIVQDGGQLLLTSENGTQTAGQWLTPTSFQAWGQTAQVVQNGGLTQILWPGNAWTQSTWQEGGLAGEWFVQSNGRAAMIAQDGTKLVLTNENGTQTAGQWLSPTSFQAWGQTAQIVQNGAVTQILWNGNTWSKSTWQDGGLAGDWFVQSNGQAASITQDGTQLLLTNENGTQAVGQWLSPTSFQAWGQTAQVVQNGAVTQILWNGNAWSQSAWQDGALAGQWFVKSDGQAASITQEGTQLVVTNEQGSQTVAQWLSSTSFEAWGQTAQVVQNGALTQIQWNGDVWTQSAWQDGALSGEWFVQSDGQAASIVQSGTQLLLTNEQGTQTVGQWQSPTSFQAGGQTGQIVQTGALTQIQWNGNVWTQSAWQDGGLTGQWFAQSNGQAASIVQDGTQLLLTNEQGTQTVGQWQSPTSFRAWGQTAHVVQNGALTQIQWPGNAWTQSAWQAGALAGQWVVQSNGLTASIAQNGTQLLLTNEYGTQTAAQWLSPTSFQAWGQTAYIVQVGGVAEIQWPGNAWKQSTTASYQGSSGFAGLLFNPTRLLLNASQLQVPALARVGGTTFSVGQAGSFTITTQGLPPTAIIEGGTLPSGVTFTNNGDGTATLAGTPAAGTAGSYTFTIAADNGLTPVATQTFTLTVDQPPAFTSATSTAFTVGQAGSFVIATSPGLPATTTLSESGALPTGVTFVDNGNGTATLSGTPVPGTGGTYALTLTASNAAVSQATQTFTLEVDRAPVITSAAGATFGVGQAGSFTVTTIGFPAAALTESGALPGGVTFTDNGNGTATLAGTPAAGTVGTYNFTISAGTSSGPAATQTFQLTVDQPPSISSAASATFSVGQAGSFTVTTSPGLPTTTLSESGALPSGVSFTDNGNGTATLHGTPIDGTGGSYAITLTAAGSAASPATQAFTLVVQRPPAITSAASATFVPGRSANFVITTRGFPYPALTESGALPSGVTFTDKGNGPATLSGIPTAGSGGTYNFTVSAANSVSSVTQNFTLTVHRPPVITSAGGTAFVVGQAGSFTVTTAAGQPAATTLSASGKLPGGVTFTAGGNGTATLHGTPAAGTAGSYTVIITASNASGAQTTQTFTLSVGQRAGITSAGRAAFVVGQAGSFTVTTSGFPAAALSESGALPSGVTFTDNGNGTATLAGTPAAGTAGLVPYSFAITASNGTGPAATQTFQLTVNQPPAITSAASATFALGLPGSFTITTAPGLPRTATTLSEAGRLPQGLTFSAGTNGTATLHGTPAAGTAGSYAITLTASNTTGLQTTQTFTLNVSQPTAPAITSAGRATFAVGQAGSFTVATTGFPAAVLSESGTLPAGVTLTDHGDGTATLSGTPAAGSGGTYNFTVSARNSVSSVTQNFTLIVNQPPAITSAAGASFSAGQSSSFTITTTGFPTGTITESGPLPSGLTLADRGNGTAVLSGKPTSKGSFTFTIIASNGVLPGALQTFTLTVQ